jgi:hypothetical protein
VSAHRREAGDAANQSTDRDELRAERTEAAHSLLRMTPDSRGYQRARRRSDAAKAAYDAGVDRPTVE